MTRWWTFVHIVGAFAFVLAHGVSSAVGIRLRRERSPERIRALLDLSRASRAFFYGSFLVLLTGGVAAGFEGRWWGQGWIWAALGLLLGLMVAAAALAVPYYRRVRRALEEAPEAEARDDDDLASLLASPMPLLIAAVGGVGLLAIVWLMVLKPF